MGAAVAAISGAVLLMVAAGGAEPTPAMPQLSEASYMDESYTPRLSSMAPVKSSHCLEKRGSWLWSTWSIAIT